MRTGGAARRVAGGADVSDNSSCLNFYTFLGIDLTQMSVEAAEVAMVNDNIVAVACITMTHSGHSALEHAIDQTVSASQIYAVMECTTLCEGVLAVTIGRGYRYVIQWHTDS